MAATAAFVTRSVNQFAFANKKNKIVASMQGLDISQCNKPATVFEFIIAEPPMLQLISPHLDIVDICCLASTSRFMRFRWPVKCNVLLNVFVKMLERFKWPHIPEVPSAITKDTCAYNVFCYIMNTNCRVPRVSPQTQWYCTGGCGSSTGQFYMNHILGPFALCAACFRGGDRCSYGEGMGKSFIKRGYVIFYEVLQFHVNLLNRLASERNLKVDYDIAWKSYDRHYFVAPWGQLNIFPMAYECADQRLIPISFVKECVEKDLQMFGRPVLEGEREEKRRKME